MPKNGPTEIRTPVTGFRVLGATDYTMEPFDGAGAKIIFEPNLIWKISSSSFTKMVISQSD
jgi:hypothetical protein